MYKRQVYIRLGRSGVPVLHDSGFKFEPGREITLSFSSSSGNETGETVYTICGILANQTLSQITGYARAVVGDGTGETYRVLAEFREQYDPREAGESIAAVLGLEQNRVTYNESLLQALADSGQEVLHLKMCIRDRLLTHQGYQITRQTSSHLKLTTEKNRIYHINISRQKPTCLRKILDTPFGDSGAWHRSSSRA